MQPILIISPVIIIFWIIIKKECVDLKGYISEKLIYHEKHSTQFDSLADLLLEHLAVIKKKQQDATSSTKVGSSKIIVGHDDDGSVASMLTTEVEYDAKEKAEADTRMKRIMAADGGGAADFFAKLGMNDGDFMKEAGSDDVNSVSFLNAKAAGIEQYSKPLGILKKTEHETVMYR